MTTPEFLIAAFAAIRLVASAGTIVLAWQDKRWVILIWGVVGVALSIPLTATAFGLMLPQVAAAAIIGGAAIQAIAVGGATLSSRGEIRRLREILRTADLEPERGTWRP